MNTYESGMIDGIKIGYYAELPRWYHNYEKNNANYIKGIRHGIKYAITYLNPKCKGYGDYLIKNKFVSDKINTII